MHRPAAMKCLGTLKRDREQVRFFRQDGASFCEIKTKLTENVLWKNIYSCKNIFNKNLHFQSVRFSTADSSQSFHFFYSEPFKQEQNTKKHVTTSRCKVPLKLKDNFVFKFKPTEINKIKSILKDLFLCWFCIPIKQLKIINI